jgi:competence protein ComEA
MRTDTKFSKWLTVWGAAAALAALSSGATALAAERPDTVEAPATAPEEGVVNINQATTEELMRLPGIGATKAEAVIGYRSKHEFKRVVELARVKGVGPKTVQRLKAWLTVSGPTTLKEKLRLAPKPKEG